MLLEGKRIIVTGGVTGIGRATVLEMAREGAQVVSMSRAAPEADNVLSLIEQAAKVGPFAVTHLQVDVAKQDQVDAAFDRAVAHMGGLDAMANHAGWALEKLAEDLTESDLWQMYSVNMCGTAFTSIASFRHMKHTGGSIINYASYAGVQGMPGLPAYSASKGAVLAYSRVIAKDWARYWIRTNVVCPAIETELFEAWCAQMPPERLELINAFAKTHIPLGGTQGKPIDAAHLNVFLASDRSRFITGQTIGVDGGLTMPR
jgi:NAD(P)-dependent dehydrogenase (short-subunit alcohol dehydrogenase family)